MSYALNKNFSETHFRTDSQIDNRTIHSSLSTPLSISFIDSFEHRIITNVFQQMPTIIKTLANLCQILDDYPLSQINIEQIQQGTFNCILWNEDQLYPIAIDQNKYLIKFRQLIREYIHEFLEFAQQILIFSNKNNEINFIIQKSMKYLSILNNYRIKRQLAYNNFSQNYTFEDSMLILSNIDKQQYYELRLIALNLRQFFLKLIKFISPKFSMLE
ncbi:unnamed protein product [Rotaria sp. Silwood1]|nr:unnamed protein product [Rotaria sp. Silwood1]CAF1419418.1 unnamed protein product [Rotaria sp. Silwood1]CAF3534826.1 unnamed protein product [Rotaria sp. Silwood1]CAF3559675.1 unnamed protein product [Rotaria sp. Silwood1]CAF3703657.1 unnamed protein product [Rotaria sp. Silwood1]